MEIEPLYVLYFFTCVVSLRHGISSRFWFEWDDLPFVSSSILCSTWARTHNHNLHNQISFTLPELADEVEFRHILYYNINPICIYPYVTPWCMIWITNEILWKVTVWHLFSETKKNDKSLLSFSSFFLPCHRMSPCTLGEIFNKWCSIVGTRLFFFGPSSETCFGMPSQRVRGSRHRASLSAYILIDVPEFEKLFERVGCVNQI